MSSSENDPTTSQPTGPIYSPPPEPHSDRTLEFVAMIIGGGLFVAVPAIWIIYVTLTHLLSR
jgi:hypothetical protein